MVLSNISNYRQSATQFILGNSAAENYELISKCSAVLMAFFLPISTSLMNILFISAVVFCILGGNLRNKINFIYSNRISFLFLVFFGLYFLGIFYSTAPFGDAISMLVKNDKFLFAGALFIIFAEERWGRYAIYAFLAGMILTLILSYLKTYGVIHFNMRNGLVSVFKTRIQTNFLMAFTAYLLAYEFVQQKSYRWPLGILLALVVYNVLFLSFGRSGYFVFFGLLMLFLWQQLRWKGLFLAIVTAALLSSGAFMTSSHFRSRINSIAHDLGKYEKGDDYTSVGLRLSFASNSVTLIKKHPIIGTGTGSFIDEYAKLIGKQGIATRNPHNEYLNVAVQLGIVGLAFLMFMFLVQLYQSHFLDERMKYLARGVVVAIMIGSIANSWLMDTTEGHFYILFMAVAFATMNNKALKKENTSA